jgi:hypothetical protein
MQVVSSRHGRRAQASQQLLEGLPPIRLHQERLATRRAARIGEADPEPRFSEVCLDLFDEFLDPLSDPIDFPLPKHFVRLEGCPVDSFLQMTPEGRKLLAMSAPKALQLFHRGQVLRDWQQTVQEGRANLTNSLVAF